MKIFIVRCLITMGIMLLLIAFWQGLEIIYYGEIKPSNVDNIICLPIMFSLYLNVKHWVKDVN